MNPRSTLCSLLAAVALSLAWFPASRVEAGFHHHRRGCGCSTCHHRGRHWGSHGSSGGSWGGGSHGGSAGGSSGGAAAAAKPTAAAPAAPGAAPAPAPAKAAGVPADGAVLVVQVPENARLFINGQATSLTGGVRHFFASDLSTESRYAYDVKVAFDGVAGAAGKEESRKVWLEAGERQVVAFTAPAAGDGPLSLPEPAVAASSPTTNLTLRVPTDARVWIAGRPTAHTGEVRRFSTTALAAGASWADYEVRVVSVVDGREREIVRRLTLTGGKDLEIALDPAGASAPVAATASLE